MLNMDLEYNQGILFVRLKGMLNRRTSYKLNNYLVPVLLKHKIKYLVYNLYSLDYIDNSGKNALLNSKCAIRNNNGKIIMCEVNDDIKEQLKSLKIKKINTELDALKLMSV